MGHLGSLQAAAQHGTARERHVRVVEARRLSPSIQGGCRVRRAGSEPPEGCMEDWVEMEDGDMATACSGKEVGTESLVGSPSWHGSEVV